MDCGGVDGGNEKPSKMGKKSRNSHGLAMCPSRSRLFFSTSKWKASKKGKGRNSLGQCGNNGKPLSEEDKRVNQFISQMRKKCPKLFDMWKLSCIHDHEQCIRSSRKRKPFEGLTYKQAMWSLVYDNEEDLSLLDLQFHGDDSSSSDTDMDGDDCMQVT